MTRLFLWFMQPFLPENVRGQGHLAPGIQDDGSHVRPRAASCRHGWSLGIKRKVSHDCIQFPQSWFSCLQFLLRLLSSFVTCKHFEVTRIVCQVLWKHHAPQVASWRIVIPTPDFAKPCRSPNPVSRVKCDQQAVGKSCRTRMGASVVDADGGRHAKASAEVR